MNLSRHPLECVDTAVTKAQQYIDEGIPPIYAFRVVGKLLGVDPEKVEYFWLLPRQDWGGGSAT